MKDITKEYTNGELTVVWKPGKCIHAAKCVKGLGEVFNPNKKPWITIDAANTEAIANQVDQCPSGALGHYYNDRQKKEDHEAPDIMVELAQNGPLLVHGSIVIKDSEGNETKESKVTALCRCGASDNKPYCDGAHKKVGFVS